MSHLGERISAFVDGELAAADRDRVLSHLAACEPCRFEAEMLRRLKSRLCHLDTPGPSTDLVGRLSSLTGAGSSDDDTPPSQPDGFTSRPPIGSSRPLGGWPGKTPDEQHERDERRNGGSGRTFFYWLRNGRIAHSTRYGLAGACVAAVTLGTAFVADTDRSSGNAAPQEHQAEETRPETQTSTRSTETMVDPTPGTSPIGIAGESSSP